MKCNAKIDDPNSCLDLPRGYFTTMYAKYISTHLREYVAKPFPIPAAQNTKVQEYLHYKGVDFCDLHLEDALMNGYWRLAMRYIDNGVLEQSTTFFNNLESMDFKKRVRIPRKLVEFPEFYEYGYICPEWDGSLPDGKVGDLERSSCENDIRNIFVWQLALQMAVRFSHDRIYDVIRVRIRGIADTDRYLEVCHAAMRQAAFWGRGSLIRNLHQLNPHDPQIIILYADACNASFIEEIRRIVEDYKLENRIYTGIVYSLLLATMYRHDVSIYREVIAMPFMRKINIRNGILVEHTTLEAYLSELAASLGFYEVVDMPWLDDEFPPNTGHHSLPDAIAVALFDREGLRLIKYIVEHPSGQSLAKSGKLAQWAIDDGNHRCGLWLVKQGYPPGEFDRGRLLDAWHRNKWEQSVYLDEIVELCMLLGVEMR